MAQMDRDEFLRLMIAELSSQKEADPEGFMQTKPRTPLEIFRKMCFDYPDVTTAEMNMLGQAIEGLSFEVTGAGSGKKTAEQVQTEQFRANFFLHPKFVENVMFINSNIDVGDKGAEATAEYESESINLNTNAVKDTDVVKRDKTSNILPAAVFLSLPYKLATCGQRRMSSVFASSNTAMEASTSSRSKPLQDWDILIEQYSQFVLSSIPSVILCMDEQTFLQHQFLQALISLATKFNDASNIGEHSLLAELYKRHKIKLGDEKQDKKLGRDGGEGEGEEEISQIKSLRIHLLLLAKDIFVMFPTAIPNHMNSMLDSIIPSKERSSFNEDAHAFLFAPKTYPDADECLFVLVVAQIAASQTTVIRDRMLTNSGTSKSSAPSADALAADNFLLSLVSECLPFLSSILNRMTKYGGESSRDEVRSYVCDLCDVCVSIDVPTRTGSAGLIGRDKRRASLLEMWTNSNVFNTLVDEAMYILFPECSSSSSNASSSISDASVDGRLSPAEVRVLHSLSSVMLQSSQVADMTLKSLKAKMTPFFHISTIFCGGESELNYMCGFGLSFLLGVNNAMAIQHSSDAEERSLLATAALGCFRYIVHRISDECTEGGSTWGLAFIATGLQSSLELLLNEFQGLSVFQRMISKHQKYDESSLTAWKRLNVDLFEQLSSGTKVTRKTSSVTKLSVTNTTTSSIGDDTATQTVTNATASMSAMTLESELYDKDRTYQKSDQATKTVLGSSQVDILRVQLKKLKSILNDEPLGSDKTD